MQPVQMSPFGSRRGVDEINLASLSLISIQSRVPKTFLNWEETFTLNGRPVVIKAAAGQEGLPHGIDVDTNAALVNLFLEQGCPADNTVEASMYELLRAMRLDDCGASYRTVNESLRRMYTASFHIQGWFDADGGKVIGTTLRLIDRIRDETRGGAELLGRPFGNNTRLRITLAEEIAGNIRRRYLRALDLDFMSGLGSPLTRGLFRMLDAEADHASTLDVNLVAWGKRCRLSDLKPYRLKRTFQPAHEELIEKGYLVSAEYRGTAQEQRLTYTFACQRPDSPMSERQLLMLGRIKALDVGAPQAEGFVRSHTETVTLDRLERAEAVLAQSRGIKRRGALAWDVLNDDAGKYQVQVGVSAVVPQKRGKTITVQSVRDVPQADPWQEALTLEARATLTVRTLKILLRGQMSEANFVQLAADVRAGRLDGQVLTAEAARAAGEMALQPFVEDLRQLLGRGEN